MKNNAAKFLLVAVCGAAVIIVLVVLMQKPAEKPAPREVAAPKATPTAVSPTATPEPAPVVAAKVTEENAQEVRYLPEKVNLPAQNRGMLNGPAMKAGNRRIRNVRAISNKSKDGELLAPKWSPDGLQMIVSRPGVEGIFLLTAATGELKRLADGSAYRAKWNSEGNIEIRDTEGGLKVYGPDGALLSSGPADDKTQTAYIENDTLYIRGKDGSVVPLTTNEDRFFSPVVSPDGQSVIYQGLETGLYMAPTDGSKDPVYIGEGNHPVWSPDSTGVVFDVTSDDGHVLTGGDIYYTDAATTERTNMTDGDNLIGQTPSVGPGGDQVAFEADGTIYVGEIH